MSGTRGTRGVLLVTAGLIGSLLYVGSAGGVARFGDVEPERFYTEAVQWMVDNDITTGTSAACFSPEDFVTRGQAAAFMWRMMGFPAPGPKHPFVDVFKDWQQDPVSWMSNNDITTGTSPTTYSPEDILTRGQLAALLYRLEGNPPPGPKHPFVDVFKDWQQDAVSWMSNNEITTGTSPTMFSPDDFVTRGQLAAFFYRYMGSPAVVVDAASPDCPDSDPTNPGDVKTCGDFDDRGAAQRWHDYYFPFFGDVARLDADGNGLACESLATTSTSSTSSTSSTTTSPTTTAAPTTTLAGGGGPLFTNTPGAGFDCADCHGANGNSGPAPDLSPPGGLGLTTAQIENQIRNGGGGMPAFESRLNDDQINTLVQYVFNDEFPP